jgi:glycosyltransferase involved in cell wall biosynthesis
VRVAIIHDWLTGMRGGEKCLESLCRLLPGAPIFTLLHNRGSVSPLIESHSIHASFVGRLPFAARHYRRYLPVFPAAAESLDVGGFDLLVSVSHCVAKGAVPRPGARHVCYCLTPVRYAWDQFEAYFGRRRTSLPKRLVAAAVAHYLRVWDTASAPRVDRFVAISRFVADRIRRYYGREASILYPPVDTAAFRPDGRAPGEHYLMVTALAPYKRVDVAIAAFQELGLPLKIVGTGPERKALERALRGRRGRIELLGHASQAELAALYASCRALVFPGVEDFGIVPLEAMASGRPVVAFAAGGALETVVPLADERENGGAGAGVEAPTGLLYDDPSPAGLAAAIRRLEGSLDRFRPPALRAHAERFSTPRFEAALAALLAEEGAPVAVPTAAGARAVEVSARSGAGPC